jgi:hypothetical protein
MTITVGTRVVIERDENLFPCRGTWRELRGRLGTVVEINPDRRAGHLTEYGVIFGKVWPRTDRPGVLRWSGDDVVTWFRGHEIRGVGSVWASETQTAIAVGDDTGAVLTSV